MILNFFSNYFKILSKKYKVSYSLQLIISKLPNYPLFRFDSIFKDIYLLFF